MDDLLGDERFADNEGDWVKAIVTDQVRPLDSMKKLQARFPHCVMLEHRPAIVVDAGVATYAERIKGQSDPAIIAGFLEYVRNGEGPTEFERELIAEVLNEQGIRQANA